MKSSKRLRASAWCLAMRQRLASSWTSWSLRLTAKRALKAERRLTLLQLETDRQLLLVKELSQRQQQLEHRQQELAESRQYRQQQALRP